MGVAKPVRKLLKCFRHDMVVSDSEDEKNESICKTNQSMRYQCPGDLICGIHGKEVKKESFR